MLKAKDKNGVSVYIDNADPIKQYYCQICNQPVMQKRGNIRTHHFSHYSSHGTHTNYVPCCDNWHYDMSDWHMNWQKRFSPNNIEKVLTLGQDKHIADLLINNIIVEFQHSAISLDSFNERNEFYTNLGYKVIWVFDLIEEFYTERIIPGKYEGIYKWSFVKKLFKEMDLNETKATIYFQFLNDEDEDTGVLERVKSLSDEGKVFKTDSTNALSIKEFVEFIQENNRNLFERPKPPVSPQIMDNCHTIEELWKDSYSKMLVKNKFNNSVIFVYGKNGKLIRDFGTGKIRCNYTKLDKNSGFYVAKNKFYNVPDENKKIWNLIHAFENINASSVKDGQADLINAEKEAIGYKNVDEILNENENRIVIVDNFYTKTRYYFRFNVSSNDSSKDFAIYEVDLKNKKVKNDKDLSDALEKMFDYKIWKNIPFSDLYN